MTDPVSIGAARAALFDRLSSIAWPVGRPGVDPMVTYGPPVAYEEQEVVSLTTLEPVTEHIDTFGDKDRTQDFINVVAIKVHDPAGTAEEVEVRCFLLADVVRAALWQEETLGGAVEWCDIVGQTSLGAQQAEGGGWVIFDDLRVFCQQQLARDDWAVS